MQAGLAPMKKRLFQETVGRYGFKVEFTRATVDTMMAMLRDVKERYLYTVIMIAINSWNIRGGYILSLFLWMIA